MDRSTAARAVGVTRRDLRSIEGGRRPADPDVLGRALQAYGGDVLDLPPRQDLVRAGEANVLVIGDERVHVDPFRDDDVAVLTDYVAAVRRQRGLDDGAVVRFRALDLVQLAAVLDLASNDLEDQLRRIAGMDRDPALHATRLLVLTGLAMALAGATTRPDPHEAWTPMPTRAGTLLFDVAPPVTADASVLDPNAVAAPSGSPDLFSVGQRDVQRVRDSSWLASDGRRSTFTTVPRVRLDAIAELVAQAAPISAVVLPASDLPAWEPQALPSAESEV